MTVAKNPLSLLRWRIWLLARGTGKMAAPKRSSFGTRLLMNFLPTLGVRAGGRGGLQPPPQILGNKRKFGQGQFLKTFPYFFIAWTNWNGLFPKNLPHNFLESSPLLEMLT